MYSPYDEEFNGNEVCCECGMEFPFRFVPSKTVLIKCPYCGTEQHPCSMCDDCDDNCDFNLTHFIELSERRMRYEGV